MKKSFIKKLTLSLSILTVCFVLIGASAEPTFARTNDCDRWEMQGVAWINAWARSGEDWELDRANHYLDLFYSRCM